MKPSDTHTAWLPEPLAGEPSAYELGSFRGVQRGSPFPRSGGGSGRARPRIELELELGPGAAAEARAAIEVLDGRTDPGVLDDLRLLLSELVTNSVRHAAAPRGTKIGLAVSLVGASVRAEVTDAGRGFEPTPRAASRLEAGGWGLHLVDSLAARWGVDRGTPARVWFELDPAR
jgi:hypothetical protein